MAPSLSTGRRRRRSFLLAVHEDGEGIGRVELAPAERRRGAPAPCRAMRASSHVVSKPAGRDVGIA